MASQAPQSSSRGFELGNVATNRILFVLALLGVLLPLNALVAHYNHLGFIYYAPHEMTLKGPYEIHIQAFVYIMEGLLAVAVYLYGFEFIFGGRVSVFQFGGNVFYTLALIVPPTYFYLWLWALIIRAGNSHGPLVYWPIIVVSEIVFFILGACMFYVIFKQLRITLSPAAASRDGLTQCVVPPLDGAVAQPVAQPLDGEVGQPAAQPHDGAADHIGAS